LLDLPDPDRSQLGKSPLDLVVCQVRFDQRPVIAASSKVGFEFQAALQEGDDSRWKVEPVEGPPPVNVVVTPDGAQQVTGGEPVKGWRFISTDTGFIVALMPDSLSVETRRYTTWDDFRATAERALGLVVASFDPEIELRVGLRYVDRMKPDGAERASDWVPRLQPHLHGLLGHETLAPTVLSQQQQVMLDIGEGAVCRFAHGTLPTDDDLEYVLDYDVYRQEARPFEATAILDVLDMFNTEALKLFQASITPTTAKALR
jgi:uncharacterized protein (TIGR04255 family)